MEFCKDRENGIYLLATTASMGNCRCGGCHCKIFTDGTIQYIGGESWQRSERISGAEALKPRPYHSELGASGFNAAMEEFRRLFKKCGNSLFFFHENKELPFYNEVYQFRSGKYRSKRISCGEWTEWYDVSTLPKYLDDSDVAIRFADSIARGEIEFLSFEERFNG